MGMERGWVHIKCANPKCYREMRRDSPKWYKGYCSVACWQRCR
jgi:hypothetical protein